MSGHDPYDGIEDGKATAAAKAAAPEKTVVADEDAGKAEVETPVDQPKSISDADDDVKQSDDDTATKTAAKNPAKKST